MDFSNEIYLSYILKCDLIGAINYVKQFPEQAETYNRYINIFELEQYTSHEVDADLNEIMTIYQKYYRDTFYLCIGKENAVEKLRTRLSVFLGIDSKDMELDDIEQNQIAELFQRKGIYFLGGRTSGYYGPYIWQTTESKTYEVELPEGIQTYTVKMLDGFISCSWADYLSFGMISTGGWTDKDGIINCVKSAYNFDSESFKVSLLKHEAQHARDLQTDPNMLSEDLEYRAKLVELIYSSERNLLEQFLQEGAASDKDNGHALAAGRIAEGFTRKLNLSHAEITQLPNEQIQDVARELFQESQNTPNL